jgi:hypothetical protein
MRHIRRDRTLADLRSEKTARPRSASSAPAPITEENVLNYHSLVKRLDLPAGW